jgi:hypothetical protein
LNFGPRDVFVTARAPGEALEQGVGKLAEGIGVFMEKSKKERERAKKEADAINIFRAAKQGDIWKIFDTVRDDDNANLATNLANVLMTKNQIDAQAELRRAQAEAKRREDEIDEQFAQEVGPSLLGAIRQHFPGSPAVTVDEHVPVLDASGQPVMKDGEPVFEKRSRVIAPAEPGEENPLYAVAQSLKGSKKLGAKQLEMLLKENAALQKAALERAQEAGLNRRAAESSARQGMRGVLDVAKEEQKQDGNLQRDDARQQDRLEAIKVRSDEIIQQIEARGAQARTTQEQDNTHEAEMKRLDRELRERLAAARQSGKPDVADREKAAHVRAIRTLIERDRTDKVSAGVKVKGESAGKAYWKRLGSRGEDFVYDYGTTQQDENALFTFLIKTWLTDDLSGAKAIDTSANLPKIREMLERLQKAKDSTDPREKKAAQMVGSGDAFKRFVDFLREVDAYVDGR